MTTTATWHKLPVEMKMAIVDAVSNPFDVTALSKVDRATHNASLHALYRTVSLKNYRAMESFLAHVPLASHGRFVRHLELNTVDSEGCDVDVQTVSATAVALLSGCNHIYSLSILMEGSLDASVLPCFARLPQLRAMTLSNTADEDTLPLSERFVVYAAATVPSLERLTLEHVSRSTLHAAELVGVYPYIPLVAGDSDIPDHPYLGPDLYLPNLLRIPTLRHLSIRDTHLGDLRWASVPFSSSLKVLEVGTCYLESEEENGLWTERLLKAAGGPHLEELTLSTGVSLTTDYYNYEGSPDTLPTPAFPLLRRLTFALAFPADLVVDTLSNLSGSPIETLHVQCYEDDVEDMCEALNEFLALRVELMASSEADEEDWFCDKLRRIDVSVIASPIADGDFPITSALGTPGGEWDMGAMGGLQDFCQDLEIQSTFQNGISTKSSRAIAVGLLPEDCLRA